MKPKLSKPKAIGRKQAWFSLAGTQDLKAMVHGTDIQLTTIIDSYREATKNLAEIHKRVDELIVYDNTAHVHETRELHRIVAPRALASRSRRGNEKASNPSVPSLLRCGHCVDDLPALLTFLVADFSPPAVPETIKAANGIVRAWSAATNFTALCIAPGH